MKKKKTLVKNKVLKTTNKIKKRLSNDEMGAILVSAIETFGIKHQLLKLKEEMNELIDEICISKGTLSIRVLEEMVDVNIVLAQFVFVLAQQQPYYSEYFDKKMRRLNKIIEAEKHE